MSQFNETDIESDSYSALCGCCSPDPSSPAALPAADTETKHSKRQREWPLLGKHSLTGGSVTPAGSRFVLVAHAAPQKWRRRAAKMKSRGSLLKQGALE